jgi:protein O-GlcNAc transferase
MSEGQLQNALRLRREGKLAEAAKIYGELLRAEPAHFEALHALGIVFYQRGQLEDAERLVGEAAKVNPGAADAAYNHACLLQKMNRAEEALASFDRALSIKPDYLEALVNRGRLLSVMKRHDDALADADRVIALRPNLAEAWNNRGGVLQALQRFEEALQNYDRALALKSNYADALKNRGALLIILQRYEEALQSLPKAQALAPADPDCLQWRGDLLALLNRPDEAASAYADYLALKPRDAAAWHARGSALEKLKRRAEALACYDKAVALAPDNQLFRISRGSMLYQLEQWEEAIRDFENLQAGECPPVWTTGYLAMCRLHCCDWRFADRERAQIAAAVKSDQFVVDPTALAAISGSPEEQLRCARLYWADGKHAVENPLWTGEPYRHERIRVAYLSADFRAHATAFLTAGIFEHHDRSRFDVSAFSYSVNDNSPMRRRLEAAFDRFVDVAGYTDAEIAKLLRQMEIDIAVDLKGYTAEGRPGIFAHRPAPVQAHYLGFPGTMGTDCVDYLIADRVVIPEDHRCFYPEKIAYLPDTYQCNDRKREIAAHCPSRADAGLPGGFVFCCFNNSHKITPEMFDIWMRLLGRTEGSVLWLLEDNPAMARNLRAEAKSRRIAPERLIFAPRTLPSAHLARHRLADLFLDTIPYNAHTTASDALWAGLPVLTVLGSAFAGRVAASLLRAAGLPELITVSLDEYEALAFALACDRKRLGAIRTKLQDNRDVCALFDTERMTRSLEAAYLSMWEGSQRGLPPETFHIQGVPRQ